MTAVQNIAYFISSHGFGHAARSSSVMASIQEKNPAINFEIFTETPAWFFQEALQGNHCYHNLKTDVGLVQSTPMQQNLPATLDRLKGFFSFEPEKVDELCRQLESLKCSLIIADISPLGIMAGRKVGIPTILIENFTWDWIYKEYEKDYPEFGKFIKMNRQNNRLATFHIQTEPLCKPEPSADLVAPPASRKPNQTRAETREKLGIPSGDRMVLVTMGGIPEQFDNLSDIKPEPGTWVVVPGASKVFLKLGQLIMLPHHSEFYHPNLIHACDAVIGKAGYSTISEVYQANVPFGYLIRRDFRESGPLAEYIEKNIAGINIPEEDFSSGNWLPYIETLLQMKQDHSQERENGANVIAQYILNLIK